MRKEIGKEIQEFQINKYQMKGIKKLLSVII